ncbi:MAG: hypothetical protein V9G13_13385 [Marmoricola sp.]
MRARPQIGKGAHLGVLTDHGQFTVSADDPSPPADLNIFERAVWANHGVFGNHGGA